MRGGAAQSKQMIWMECKVFGPWGADWRTCYIIQNLQVCLRRSNRRVWWRQVNWCSLAGSHVNIDAAQPIMSFISTLAYCQLVLSESDLVASCTLGDCSLYFQQWWKYLDNAAWNYFDVEDFFSETHFQQRLHDGELMKESVSLRKLPVCLWVCHVLL